MSAALERHGGTVEKFIGDAIMAVFGMPTAHEDDALRAVRGRARDEGAPRGAERRAREALGGHAREPHRRQHGQVIAGEPGRGQRLVTGDTVNVAARLEQAAPGQEVLIGEPTYRLVRDYVEVEEVEPLELKGKSERVPAYRLLSVTEGAGARAGRRCRSSGASASSRCSRACSRTPSRSAHADSSRSSPTPAPASRRLIEEVMALATERGGVALRGPLPRSTAAASPSGR